MLFVLLLALLQPAPADARDEAERLFALGRQLFAEGDAEGAVAAFERAGASVWTSAELEFNLGTACLATGDLGCAVLHLERAQRLRPGDSDVLHNLRIARARAGTEPLPEPPVRLAVATLSRTFGLPGLLALGFGLYLVVLVLAGLRMWTRRDRAWLRRALLVLAPVAVLALGVGVAAWLQARTPEAVVVAGGAALHAGPVPEAPEQTRLNAGQVVRLTERRGEWVEVQVPGGARGWLPARTVEAI